MVLLRLQPPPKFPPCADQVSSIRLPVQSARRLTEDQLCLLPREAERTYPVQLYSPCEKGHPQIPSPVSTWLVQRRKLGNVARALPETEIACMKQG